MLLSHSAGSTMVLVLKVLIFKHFHDAICGRSAPATQNCLWASAVLINLLLSRKVYLWLFPRLVGASLTAS